MFVSVERQNQLQMYRIRGDNLEPAPAYVVTTLNEPGNLRPEQAVGPIHIHPNGRFVYVGNRASGLIEAQGKKYVAGGENSIAVFAINQASGEPRLIQADRHAGISSAHLLDRSRLYACSWSRTRWTCRGTYE